ncbi:MAG: hypothetical protein LBH31_09855 [Burkholderiaceae bacterium]|nr:hypothetical protein [Burkholderiaceae bacterium]
MTNPAEGTSAFEYDTAGNITSQTDPLGRIERTDWHDQWELLLRRSGFDGSQWRWNYDTLGNLLEEKS